MSNRWLRFVIAVLAIGAASAAGYRIFQQDHRLAADIAAARTIDLSAETAIVTISELKAAMHAYVAEGQGEAFWTARAATLLDRVRASILELEASAAAAGVTLTETLDLTDRLAASEKRAHEHVRAGQRLMAGDVIFTEARDILDAMRLQVARARTEIGASATRAQNDIRSEQRMLALGAVGILAFATLLLVIPGNGSGREPVSTLKPASASEADEYGSSARVISRVAAAPATAAPAAKPAAPHALGSPASLGGSPAATTSSPSTGSGPRRAAVPANPSSGRTTAATPSGSGARVAPAAAAASYSGISLKDAAAVCTDLGRASQTIEISALLDRAAKVMNAVGAIVWMASPDGREMYPAASAGYEERLLLRIGAIKRDANNVTAAALRDAAPRTSPSAASSAAALAVPLMTPLGPVGVFSAEIRDIAAVDEARLAVATIFAAQLATLLGSMATPAVAPSSSDDSAEQAKAQA